MYVEKSSTSVAGNANHDIVAPSDKILVIHYGHITLTTDATAANRYLDIGVLNETPTEIFDTHSGAAVTASTSNQHHVCMQGIYRETSFTNGSIQVPIPVDFIIKPNYTFRISITNGVAGDSYDSHWIISELPVTANPFTILLD